MRISLKSLFRCAAICFLLTGPRASLCATETLDAPAQSVETNSLYYLARESVSAAELLAPPPAAGSAEEAAELALVRAVCHEASSNEVAAANSEKKFSVFIYAPEVGTFFQSNNLPKTTAFFEKVQSDAEVVTGAGKIHFHRPRPYRVDPTLAEGKLEKTFSYPSGHSTESMVLALVLVELFPGQRDAIIAHACGIGWHRVQIARHYPTDIHAGRVLAKAIVREMKTAPDFHRDFEEAKREIAMTKLHTATLTSPTGN